jgi:hypothetical protein
VSGDADCRSLRQPGVRALKDMGAKKVAFAYLDEPFPAALTQGAVDLAKELGFRLASTSPLPAPLAFRHRRSARATIGSIHLIQVPTPVALRHLLEAVFCALRKVLVPSATLSGSEILVAAEVRCAQIAQLDLSCSFAPEQPVHVAIPLACLVLILLLRIHRAIQVLDNPAHILRRGGGAGHKQGGED